MLKSSSITKLLKPNVFRYPNTNNYVKYSNLNKIFSTPTLNSCRTQPLNSFKLNCREYSGRVSFRFQPDSQFKEAESLSTNFGGALSFSLIGSVLAFGTGAILYQDYLIKKRNHSRDFSNQFQNLIESLFISQDKSTGVKNHEDGLFDIIKREFNQRIDYINQELKALTRSEKVLYSIIGLNSIIFVMWQIKRFQPFMEKHFLHHPDSNRFYTTLTSTFSHKDLWHLGLNMFALKSFGEALTYILGAEQFLAFYLASGMLSSMGRRAAISLFPKIFSSSAIIPCLGASGAIFALVGTVAYHLPHTRSNIIFLPGFSFELQYLLAFFMSMDFLGIVRGWRIFDHFAHLTGALVGLAYGKWGREYIWLPINRALLKLKRFLKRLE